MFYSVILFNARTYLTLSRKQLGVIRSSWRGTGALEGGRVEEKRTNGEEKRRGEKNGGRNGGREGRGEEDERRGEKNGMKGGKL